MSASLGDKIQTVPKLPRHTVVFHDLAQAVDALEAARRADRPVMLITAEGSAEYAGAQYLLCVVQKALAAVSDVQAAALIDCGDRLGMVRIALRTGWRDILFRGSPGDAVKCAQILEPKGVRLWREHPEDLGFKVLVVPAADCRPELYDRFFQEPC